jgi:hypothetical protein
VAKDIFSSKQGNRCVRSMLACPPLTHSLSSFVAIVVELGYSPGVTTAVGVAFRADTDQ